MAINYSICFPHCLSPLISAALRRWDATPAWVWMLQRNECLWDWHGCATGGERGHSHPRAWQSAEYDRQRGWSEAVSLGCWAKAVRLWDGERRHCPAFPRNGLYFFLSYWPPGTAALLPDDSSHNLIEQELLPLQVTQCLELLGNTGVSMRKGGSALLSSVRHPKSAARTATKSNLTINKPQRVRFPWGSITNKSFSTRAAKEEQIICPLSREQ